MVPTRRGGAHRAGDLPQTQGAPSELKWAGGGGICRHPCTLAQGRGRPRDLGCNTTRAGPFPGPEPDPTKPISVTTGVATQARSADVRPPKRSQGQTPPHGAQPHTICTGSRHWRHLELWKRPCFIGGEGASSSRLALGTAAAPQRSQARSGRYAEHGRLNAKSATYTMQVALR